MLELIFLLLMVWAFFRSPAAFILWLILICILGLGDE